MNNKFLFILVLAFFSQIRVVFASDKTTMYPSLQISNPWSFEAMYAEIVKKYGEQDISKKQTIKNQGLFEFLYIPPFNLLSLVYFKAAGRDSDGISAKAVSVCSYQRTIEGKISCLSLYISSYVKDLPQYQNGVTLDYRTFCALAANLFFKAFNSLNVKGSRAGFVEASWRFPHGLHVVNSVFITSTSGVVFSYVMDVGSLPGILFPLSEPTIKWHTDSENNSKTIKFKFPDIQLF